MTDAPKGNENRQPLIFRIEKPVIRIEADKELIVMDDYILIQEGVLPQDFKRDYEKEHWMYGGQPPDYLYETFVNGRWELEKTYGDHTFTELKTAYLTIQGFEFATPGWGAITHYDHLSIYLTGIVLTYRSERDLTLSQLDELLTAIMEKLESIVADLGLEMSVIRKITVQGYREQGIVFDVFDDLIDYINSLGLEDSKREDAISYEVELIGLSEKTNWFLSEVGPKYESENVNEVLELLAEKLDKFRNALRGA